VFTAGSCYSDARLVLNNQTVNALQLKADSLEKDAKKVKALQSEIDCRDRRNSSVD